MDYDIYIAPLEPKADPLDVLFLSSKDLAREIARILKGRVTIDGTDIIFTDDLKVIEKVLCYFLAVCAIELVGRRTNAIVTPYELERDTGLLGNSIRPYIKRLVDHHFVTAYKNSEYKLKLSALYKIEVFLNKGYRRWQ